MISEEHLEILACPACKGRLALLDDGTALDCPDCALRFRVRDGIPVMLLDEAEKIGERQAETGEQ